MKVNNQNAWLQPALDVIKATAPKIYAEMQETDWKITVVADADDFMPTFDALIPECGMYDSYGMISELAGEMDHSYGVTVAKTDEHVTSMEVPTALRNATYLNVQTLEAGAKEMDVPLPKMIADTMVHEFTHRKGKGEDAAYAQGEKFAKAMGELTLAKSQVETGAMVAFDKTMKAIFGE